jgi:hypothetical protein
MEGILCRFWLLEPLTLNPRPWLDQTSAAAFVGLAGVSVFPFHVAADTLPDIGDGAWRQLVMRSDGASPSAGNLPLSQAALLLSEPHFSQVSRANALHLLAGPALAGPSWRTQRLPEGSASDGAGFLR